jgi:hypothetical protein
MSKVSEEGFLFIHSGIFDQEQIELNLSTCIKKLDVGPCEMYVNVVENREGLKYGHTYAWVSNPKVYYALIGKNFDGSDRVEMIEDEGWETPDEDMDELIEEAGDDWALIGEIEERFERPMIQKELGPLIVPPGIKYTEKQKAKMDDDDEYGFIEIFPARVTIRTEEKKINSIYSSCLPNWVDEAFLFNLLKKFSRDKTQYVEPKTKKKFYYPKIVISKNKTKSKWRSDEDSNNAQIFFSPLNRNLSFFLINVIKKMKVVNPKTNKEELLFFSQSKSRAS